MLDAIVNANEKIEVILNTKATELIANEKGQVLTVKAEGPNGEVTYPAEKGVIIATGGYSSNRKLMGQYTQYGEPDQFGREFNVQNTYNMATNKIEGDKFYAIRLHALCVMTLGGVTANADMQVLDVNGNVIPGLYAAGEVVGGIWGKFVSGGTGVMGPIVFGQVAARHAMANTPAEGYEVKAAPAFEPVTAAIVANNDATVDAVAGATLTSNRIMNAVAQCLEAAAK